MMKNERQNTMRFITEDGKSNASHGDIYLSKIIPGPFRLYQILNFNESMSLYKSGLLTKNTTNEDIVSKDLSLFKMIMRLD